MSFAHPSWSPVESTDNPMIFTFLRSNCGFIFAMYPSSVVHTGVKSFGCENKTAHESPIQSWKRIRPSVVCASKSGAVSPIFIILSPRLCFRILSQIQIVKVNRRFSRSTHKTCASRCCRRRQSRQSALSQLCRSTPQQSAKHLHLQQSLVLCQPIVASHFLYPRE